MSASPFRRRSGARRVSLPLRLVLRELQCRVRREPFFTSRSSGPSGSGIHHSGRTAALIDHCCGFCDADRRRSPRLCHDMVIGKHSGTFRNCQVLNSKARQGQNNTRRPAQNQAGPPRSVVSRATRAAKSGPFGPDKLGRPAHHIISFQRAGVAGSARPGIGRAAGTVISRTAGLRVTWSSGTWTWTMPPKPVPKLEAVSNSDQKINWRDMLTSNMGGQCSSWR